MYRKDDILRAKMHDRNAVSFKWPCLFYCVSLGGVLLAGGSKRLWWVYHFCFLQTLHVLLRGTTFKWILPPRNISNDQNPLLFMYLGLNLVKAVQDLWNFSPWLTIRTCVMLLMSLHVRHDFFQALIMPVIAITCVVLHNKCTIFWLWYRLTLPKTPRILIRSLVAVFPLVDTKSILSNVFGLGRQKTFIL